MYTLYVSRDRKRPERFCVGSALCMRIMEYIPKAMVNLVEHHPNSTIPSWLIGTPTLAPEKGVEIYRGTEAVLQLLHIAISESKSTTEGKARKEVTFQKEPTGVMNEDPQEAPWITETPSIVEEDDSMLTGKLTMEDLNRAVSARTQSTPPAPTGTPPPPPPPEDD